jgi:hypothetical protein
MRYQQIFEGVKRATVIYAVLAFVGAPIMADAQTREGEGNITYASGQSVLPVFQGWIQNPDGTFDLHFGYINQNWVEQVDVPIGADNSVSMPFGPDAGQPAHFYPRQNRWQFRVRVPKDFGTKEVVWTLASHGQTHRAYGTLNPGYAMDEGLMQFEFGTFGARDAKTPTLTVDGERQRSVKVGQAVPLVAVAIDNSPTPAARGQANAPSRPYPAVVTPGEVGGDFVRTTAGGLRLAWLVYRGDAKAVRFDPPIPFKVWEDQRGGSPWSPGWTAPPVPPNNKWVHNVTFSRPGVYVVRALAHTGLTFAYENITFNVTP